MPLMSMGSWTCVRYASSMDVQAISSSYRCMSSNTAMTFEIRCSAKTTTTTTITKTIITGLFVSVLFIEHRRRRRWSPPETTSAGEWGGGFGASTRTRRAERRPRRQQRTFPISIFSTRKTWPRYGKTRQWYQHRRRRVPVVTKTNKTPFSKSLGVLTGNPSRFGYYRLFQRPTAATGTVRERQRRAVLDERRLAIHTFIVVFSAQ